MISSANTFANNLTISLKRAKNSKNEVITYYNFVNAYRLLESGEESYGNICCMAIDRDNELLRSKNK